MTDTSRLHESVDLECRNIHDAIICWQVSAEDGQRWQLMLRSLLARAEAAEAKLEAYAEIISDIGTANADADEWLEKNFGALTLKTEANDE